VDGCRRWLVVRRDTFTHEFGGTRDASGTAPLMSPIEKLENK
jgi:sarcosine oxidase delta subunit